MTTLDGALKKIDSSIDTFSIFLTLNALETLFKSSFPSAVVAKCANFFNSTLVAILNNEEWTLKMVFLYFYVYPVLNILTSKIISITDFESREKHIYYQYY
ncbi:hypothetical protein AYI70_g1303 [Smittium culicis]|uniref:Uncharacterized protein n=1 Tax=Smittium culicis TaxID=133412 RepID=A0A1R1YD87_9FUNG|nr:hypothetical protein AYI70_g9137 [Smittium culicis]OMJ24840.1 hypothetical protein AYI70_g1303 [Smittium culicis]